MLEVFVSLTQSEIEPFFNHPVIIVLPLLEDDRGKKPLYALASVHSPDGDIVQDDCEEDGGYDEEEGEEEPSQELDKNKR